MNESDDKLKELQICLIIIFFRVIPMNRVTLLFYEQLINIVDVFQYINISLR